VQGKGGRRTPRQRRARETVDAIVEAAAQVFAQDGLQRSTTARIAEVAGVSVGSMYQYFPNKESLITALFERESNHHQRVFLELAAERGIDDMPALIRAYVAALIAMLEANAPLNRVLLEEVPRVAGLGPTQAVDAAAARSLQLLLELGRDRIRPKNLRVAAMLLVRALRYNTIALVREPLVGTEREDFIDELSAMLASYLLAPRPTFR
jgi:AcrR family transcriptional regulator